MKIKFCGFTRDQDVRAALALGVDAIGLNLAHGPRKITVERAAELARIIPASVMAVALFVDADEVTILAALSVIGCTAVQLHGDEPPELAERLRRHATVIKAFRVSDAASLAAVRGYPADLYLLDAAVPGQSGGTGTAWDHGLLAGVDLGKPVMLAGGLNPGNIAAAIARVQPAWVDTASGIESASGIKDPVKMAALVAACQG